MSAGRREKYRASSRAKGAAIAWFNSDEARAIRHMRRRSLWVRFVLITVALIEALLMLGVSTYSWIESTSSLVIRGDKMPVTKNRYYQMTTAAQGSLVDLHDYFYGSADFQFAKASSPDGKTMYFPLNSAMSDLDANVNVLNGSYRKGDTTDYNNAYYCFDIRLNNSGSSTVNYYFQEDSTLFSVTGVNDSTVTSAAAKCYRLSVQQGNTTKIYTSDSSNRSYTAANSTAVNNNGASVTAYAPTNYTYSTVSSVLSSRTPVCTVGGSTTADITIRVWFEFNDPAYKALTAAQKKLLYDTKVNIDLKLVNSASDVRSYYFDDFSGATFDDANKSTFASSENRMFFVYYEDGTTKKYIKMVPYEHDGTYVRWRTANSEDNPTDVMTKDMRDKMKESATYNASYFYYGKLTGNPTVDGNILTGGSEYVVKKWKMTEAPKSTLANDGGLFVYTGYGVTDYSTYDQAGCYGEWRGVDETDHNTPTAVYFDDKMSLSVAADYNIGGTEPIKTAGGRTMYVSTGSSVSSGNANKTVRMIYDNGLYRAYLPYDALSSNTYFYYLTGDYVSSYKLKFTASATDSDHTTYTALGFGGVCSTLTAMSSVTGCGTWEDVDLIEFSTELIDFANTPAYRYQISSSAGTYYMAGSEDHMSAYAYLPGSVTSAGFRRYDTYTDNSVDSTWASADRYGSNTFYPIDIGAAAHGYWHISVLVDGTRDNLINTILTENSGEASLTYSINDGDDFVNMTKIDNYRWCVPNLTEETEVLYKFTAYTGDEEDSEEQSLGYHHAEFNFTHDLSDGIYFTLTESSQSVNVIEPEPEPTQPDPGE